MSSPMLVNQKRSYIAAESNAPVTDLKEAGVAIPVPTLLNSPESGWSRRMAVDQRELNRMASPMTASVPDGCVHSNKSTQPLAMGTQLLPGEYFFLRTSSQGPGRANSILLRCFLGAVSVPPSLLSSHASQRPY